LQSSFRFFISDKAGNIANGRQLLEVNRPHPFALLRHQRFVIAYPSKGFQALRRFYVTLAEQQFDGAFPDGTFVCGFLSGYCDWGKHFVVHNTLVGLASHPEMEVVTVAEVVIKRV